MRSARTAVIDRTDISVVTSCPLCAWREVAMDEPQARWWLHRHFNTAHLSDPNVKPHRETQRKWLLRNGVRFA